MYAIRSYYAFKCLRRAVKRIFYQCKVSLEIACHADVKITLGNLAQYLCGFFYCVITSYSIHYTKLYENTVSIRFGLDIGSTTVKCVALDQDKVIVITSYSIHYTKLYEGA